MRWILALSLALALGAAACDKGDKKEPAPAAAPDKAERAEEEPPRAADEAPKAKAEPTTEEAEPRADDDEDEDKEAPVEVTERDMADNAAPKSALAKEAHEARRAETKRRAKKLAESIGLGGAKAGDVAGMAGGGVPGVHAISGIPVMEGDEDEGADEDPHAPKAISGIPVMKGGAGQDGPRAISGIPVMEGKEACKKALECCQGLGTVDARLGASCKQLEKAVGLLDADGCGKLLDGFKRAAEALERSGKDVPPVCE